MPITIKITDLFGANLAATLAEKLKLVYPEFVDYSFISAVGNQVFGKPYTKRIEIIADELACVLPQDYPQALCLLLQILGEENPNETGMFKHYYWIMPIGKFVEKYGLDHFELSMDAIAEITKRNTGEYAVRPYIRKYPQEALKRLKQWAQSESFHLRRLASEGLRPKLPWAPKLIEFVANPEPVFAILESLKEDESKFVQRSVANHLTDYLKVNPEPTRELIQNWRKSSNKNTQWILKHATRKLS
jgi:3-methyladenine DNA glycosylase AlkC